MSKKDKVLKLTKALEQLKQEFVGLDSIIDEIGRSISTWYITPELLKRPAVVSLWGMTGTGKSSVIRRLVEILELRGTSAFIDCGEYLADGKSMTSDLCDMLSIPEESLDSKVDIPEDIVVVLDEFQYARTLNEAGEEITKATLRPIWSLIDSGIVPINEYYSWAFSTAMNFIEDFREFVKLRPDAIIDKNCLINQDDVKVLLETLGLIHYTNRYVDWVKEEAPNKLKNVLSSTELADPMPIMESTVNEDSENKENPFRPIKVLLDEYTRSIVKRLSNCKRIDLAKEILTERVTAEEFLEKLLNIRKLISTPRELNLSKSLIFVIGNLDEAFGVQKSINPDYDADIFNDITSKVSVQDIKTSLKDRFRAEQVARLGNNLIKYPTLRKEHFQEIIQREVNRLVSDFLNVTLSEKTNLKIFIDQKFMDLLYSEGVYPVQGVRPVITTINTLTTPIFSTILLELEENEKSISISVDEDDFNVDKATVVVTFSKENSSRAIGVPLQLQLGSLRNPKNRNTRFGSGIHEAGHAVVFSYLTGELPKIINAVSANGGGFCSTYRKDQVRNREDVDIDVMISMAGFLAESHFFDDNKILLGSDMDINGYWNNFRSAVGKLGYFNPVPYTLYESESSGEIPESGFDITNTVVEYFNGTCFTGERMTVEDAMKRRLAELKEKTKKIISKEERLIKEVGLRLGEKGSLRPSEFLDLVQTYGKEINLQETKERVSSDYYENKLRGHNA